MAKQKKTTFPKIRSGMLILIAVAVIGLPLTFFAANSRLGLLTQNKQHAYSHCASTYWKQIAGATKYTSIGNIYIHLYALYDSWDHSSCNEVYAHVDDYVYQGHWNAYGIAQVLVNGPVIRSTNFATKTYSTARMFGANTPILNYTGCGLSARGFLIDGNSYNGASTWNVCN